MILSLKSALNPPTTAKQSFLEDVMNYRPLVLISPGHFQFKTDKLPVIQPPEGVPIRWVITWSSWRSKMTNFRIVNVQRDIGNSFIIRLEHWQQNYIKAEPVPVDLQKIFPEIQLLTFSEYYLSKFVGLPSLDGPMISLEPGSRFDFFQVEIIQ